MSSRHEVEIKITAANLSDPAFKALIGDLQNVGTTAQTTQREIAQMSNSTRLMGFAAKEMRGIGSTMIGVASGVGLANAAIGTLSKGFGFFKDSVIGTNREMEEARATLLALTKDAGETDKIIAAMNKEAAKTPFTFGQISAAYVSLLPLTKQYKLDLQELVEVSELLAASNPQEGLEGAAFALREALSGDYTSLIERFNLSRAAINELKADGVPALEIVRQSMAGLGIDAELLARRAETTGAKWNTFTDNLRLGLAKLGKPLYDALGASLDIIIDSQDEISGVLDDIGEIGKAIGTLPPFTVLKFAVEMSGDEGMWDFIKGGLYGAGITPKIQGVQVLGDGARSYNDFNEETAKRSKELAELTHENTNAFQQYVDNHIQGSDYISQDWNAIYQDAEAYFFQQQQLDAQTRRLAEAERDRTNAAAQGADRRTSAARDEGRSLEEQATIRDYAAEQTRRQNMETLDYISTLDAQAEAAYRASEAQSLLLVTQDRLADAYQQGLKVQSEYTAQGNEYASQASNIEDALEIVQQKQADGIELTEQEIFIRDHATEALDRYKGGQEDAALTAGEYAIRNGMVMKAQDELNAALGRGEISQEEYAQKMRDAYAAAGLTYDATANNSTIMGTMSSTIANELVPAILNLIQKLDELNGKHVTATVETKFITTGSPVGQVYGQQVSGGYIGVEEHAAGGYIDHPMLSMVGEEAPAHPEFIIPTNPSRRGRAMGLWLDAGRALGVPGFADGGGGRTLAGNTGGVAAGQGAGLIDWSWLFAGLDVEAENYTDRAADAFEGLFNDISALASGDAMKRAKAELDDMLAVRQIAIESGAGAEVVAGLDAQIAAKQSEVEAIGAAMGTDIVRGIQSELAQANLADMMNDAWTSAFRDLDGILDGSQAKALEGQLDELQTKLKLALAGGAPEEVVKAIKENIAEVQRELQATESIYDAAKDAGLVDTSVFKMPLDEISKILPEMRDGGLSMIDELVKGVSDGSANLGGAMGLIQQMIDADTDNLAETVGASAADIQDTLLDLQQSLMKDLAEALAKGSDPEVIKQNLAIVEALLGDVSLQVKETSEELRNLVSGQLIKPPTGSKPSGGFNATDVRNGTVRIGNTINLYTPDSSQMAQWYADQQYRDEMLAPVGIGG